MITSLPMPLRRLVHDTITILGLVIKEQCGDAIYKHIDAIRQQMVSYRRVSMAQKDEILAKLYQDLLSSHQQEKRYIAHGFTLMMELINSCENAYRTHRLQCAQSYNIEGDDSSANSIIFVLTAHPTEARSPGNITVFQQIQACCLELLKCPTLETKQRLKHLLKLAWLIPVARHIRPTVEDEAEHIYSIVLRRDMLNTLLKIRQQHTDIRLRTWVGGDKDGHPGVNEKVMLRVMSIARVRFVDVMMSLFQDIDYAITLISIPTETLCLQLKKCQQALRKLKKLRDGDGARLLVFQRSLQTLQKLYNNTIGDTHPSLRDLRTILDVFPGLLIPLELREDASEINRAVRESKISTIEKMLQTIARLSHYSNPEYYAKGFIISMTKSVSDIETAIMITNRIFKRKTIRVVPLFETGQALKDAPEIMKTLLAKPIFLNRIKKRWHNKLEVMLGYSDSAKGMGVLCSRLSIAKTIRVLDRLIKQYEIKPIFFHGSGGSVDRGGGSIEEQTAAWPESAFHISKTTIQGEMVERCFATPEILQSMVSKLLLCSRKKRPSIFKYDTMIEKFAQAACQHYEDKQHDPVFLEVINKATSYSYLQKLKFGSRPAKRSQTLSIDSLRAIPWILCWTQTRVLFPTWWGVGSAWSEIKASKTMSHKLQLAYQSNPLFRSFIKLLGFTLSKVELPIWKLYLQKSTLDADLASQIDKEFRLEYKRACQCVRTITGKKELLWFRPWLKDSIVLRSSMINPLNIIQIIAINDNDAYLIRETVTGIASGMLTTG